MKKITKLNLNLIRDSDESVSNNANNINISIGNLNSKESHRSKSNRNILKK